jgi:type IV pilus assembly protein PilQ
LLQLKINQDRPGHQMVLGMPTISTRQMVTSVLVRDGETVVLGGIREQNTEVGEARLPWLSRLPVIGWLFKRENRQRARRELLIFVTPSIVT